MKQTQMKQAEYMISLQMDLVKNTLCKLCKWPLSFVSGGSNTSLFVWVFLAA